MPSAPFVSHTSDEIASNHNPLTTSDENSSQHRCRATAPSSSRRDAGIAKGTDEREFIAERDQSSGLLLDHDK